MLHCAVLALQYLAECELLVAIWLSLRQLEAFALSGTQAKGEPLQPRPLHHKRHNNLKLLQVAKQQPRCAVLDCSVPAMHAI